MRGGGGDARSSQSLHSVRSHTHRLQAPAIARTAQAVAAFAAEARKLGAVFTRVIATSAARDAANPDRQ